MASIADSQNVMTIFYSIATGDVKVVCGGFQDMNYFGDAQHDYNYNYIVVEYDLNLMMNPNLFKVVNDEVVLANNYAPKTINIKEED